MGILDDLDDVGLGHLKDLVDQVKRGQCVLFLGAGVSTEVGLPSAGELASILAKEINAQPKTLSNIAQDYETLQGRQRLFQRVRELIEHQYDIHQKTTSFDLLSEIMPIHSIFTTNWDDKIERSFLNKNKTFLAIRHSSQVPQIRNEIPTIVKLHGDVKGKPDEIVMTRDDFLNTYKEVTRPGSLFNLLSVALSANTLLLVGYGLDDDDFRLLYSYVGEATASGKRRHYAVMLQPTDVMKKEWLSRNVVILENTAYKVFEHIAHQVRDFVNREDEKRYVVGPDAKPFTEFFGVTGSGKTELLKKIQDSFHLDGGYLVAFVSFNERPDITPLDLAEKLSRQTLNRGLDDPLQKAKKELGLVDSSDNRILARANRIAVDELTESWASKHVALLFDDSEQIPIEIRQWIEYELVPALQRQFHDLKVQLRIVFAGRRPVAWQTPTLPQRLNRFSLSSFDESAVGEMLDWFAALKVSDPLPLNKRHQILIDLLDLSGGHPGCIKGILEKLAQKNFDVSDNYIGAHEKTLFKEIVLPILHGEILQKVPAEFQSALELVSIFRRLSPDFLDVLMEKGYLENKHGNGLTLLGSLCGTYLVLLPRPPAQLYDIDPLVRHILALRMRLLETQRFQKMNALALEIYDHAVMGKTVSGDPLPFPPSNELRITYIIEIMYHILVHAISKNVPVKRVRSDVKEKLEIYLEVLQVNASLYELKRLFDMLEARFGEDPDQADRDLLSLATKLFPDDGYHMFLEPIREFRKRRSS